MPLTNFGAILNFAETVEREDMAFYTRAADAAGDPSLKEAFEAMAKEGRKNVSLVQRTRRENVTEMILEAIRDFTRAPYLLAPGDPTEMDTDALQAAAVSLERRAVRYYGDAAEKIRALPEVSRALKSLAKKRSKRLARLENSES